MTKVFDKKPSGIARLLTAPSELTSRSNMSSQSMRVFDRVCQKIFKDINAFMAQLSDGVSTYIEPIKDAEVAEVLESVLEWMNNGLAAEERIIKDDLHARVSKSVNELISRGEVFPLAAKVFLYSLPCFEDISNYYYDDIMGREPYALPDTYSGWKTTILEIWNDDRLPKGSKKGNSGFFTFNKHAKTDQVVHRLYITAATNAMPHRLLETWRNSLFITGCQLKINFKVAKEADEKYDTIVIYLTDDPQEAESIEKVVSAFTRECPPDLLAEEDMPTGIPLGKGISYAPEPEYINRLVYRLSKKERIISYNQFIAAVVYLSFALALHDAQSNPNVAVLADPRSMKDPAARYFEQLLKLSDISPETMLPYSQGGKLPSWAQRIRDAISAR